MKIISNKELRALSLIASIFIIMGINDGISFLNEIKPVFNLARIAFAGFISFAIVGFIMALGRNVGIWFGKRGESILYTVVLILVGILLF